MSLKAIESSLNEMQTELGGPKHPCSRMRGGASCVRQHDGKFDKDGRPVFYFGVGCKVAETFCDSCLAYWLVAVARNAVISMMRR